MAESKENDKFDLGVKGLSNVDLSLRNEKPSFLSVIEKNKTKQKIADVFFIVHTVKVRTS